MSYPSDLRAMLDEWEFDPDRNLRLIEFENGRTVMQVRLPLGVEQYEVTGRPDGARPHGMESCLAYHMARLKRAERRGLAGTFALSHSDCEELLDEGMLYYYRYLNFFQMQDWKRTLQDTHRNLALFDFVKLHAADPGDSHFLEQWRPYIIRIHAVARAMLALEAERFEEAHGIVSDAIMDIQKLPVREDAHFRSETEHSVSALREMLRKIEAARPLSAKEQLERELERAIADEAFEHAAAIRDRLNHLPHEDAEVTSGRVRGMGHPPSGRRR